ncbi:MAG TPA: TonB-dependent receptor [Saprospiraceae bacterium]|nr:TonB-dependent receptor [Saprospiraceae bacterium]
MKTTLAFALFCWASLSFAQNGAKFTINGTLTDAASGETLIGVTVRAENGTGAVSNEYGFYSLTLPEGEHTFSFAYLGYVTVTRNLKLTQNQKLDIALSDNSTMLGEIEIKAEKREERVERALMGVEKINMADLKSLPMLLGERDVLKTIQLLPGVKSAGEGNAGFYVRGGAADQNLILLDEAPVYNASHLLGFFSTFNADAVKDATLYKGSMPPQYGGRISSVLDIKMNDGNNQDFKVSGGIGLISSKLNLEGPLQKGKSSFLLTARRTYLDLLLLTSSDSVKNSTVLYFYDLNAKVNYQIDSRNRLFASGYFGRDVLRFGSGSFGVNWGNATATLRWNHLFSDRLFSNTSLIYSNYDNNIAIQFGANDFQISSRIKDYNLKQDFQWFPNSHNTVKYGFQVINHTITPSSVDASEASDLVSNSAAQKRYGLESAAFVSHEWQATGRLNLIYGIRISDFAVLGAGDFYTYDADGKIMTTKTYGKGAIVKNYIVPEPRLAASYRLTERSSIKAGYTRNSQYLHLLSNSTASNPTDLWMPTTNNVKAEIADQVSVGWFRNFGSESQFEFSAETYYKNMLNQIDYRNGAEIQGNENPEADLLYGSGRAYGFEVLLKKKSGRLNGWISYTLARTERKIPGINNGEYYAAKQDRTHDLSVVGMYQLTARWQLSANWIYYTGNAVTFPSGKYEVDGATSYYYTQRNGSRMPDFHRLDLGAVFQGKKTKRFESEWAFSIYNVYNRKNAYTITFRDSESKPGTTEALKTSLFGIIPSASWNFKF